MYSKGERVVAWSSCIWEELSMTTSWHLHSWVICFFFTKQEEGNKFEVVCVFNCENLQSFLVFNKCRLRIFYTFYFFYEKKVPSILRKKKWTTRISEALKVNNKYFTCQTPFLTLVIHLTELPTDTKFKTF